MPAAVSSCSAALIIGPSSPKSAELTESSAASTIWCPFADGLGVIALHPTARGLDVARVGITDIDLAGRLLGRPVGLGRRPEATAVLHHPARPVSRITGVRGALGPQLFLQAPPGLRDPRGT